MGVVTETPFPTYPHGFPADVMTAFREATGYDVLGNVVASGTEIIQRLGDEHVRTGKPIVYTSADSVFQIAAHEDVIPLRGTVPPLRGRRAACWCRRTRSAASSPGPSAARPAPTSARPTAATSPSCRRPHLVLHALREAGVEVATVGKIVDLYAGQGVDRAAREQEQRRGHARARRAVRRASRADPALIMLNLGRLRHALGPSQRPRRLPRRPRRLRPLAGAASSPRCAPGDLLLLTADHGNDPTTPSTDHSREQVPLLACARRPARAARDLGTRATFADVGATIADYFGARRAAPRPQFPAAAARRRGGEDSVTPIPSTTSCARPATRACTAIRPTRASASARRCCAAAAASSPAPTSRT